MLQSDSLVIKTRQSQDRRNGSRCTALCELAWHLSFSLLISDKLGTGLQAVKSTAPPEEHASSDLSDGEVSEEDLQLLSQYGGRLSFLQDLNTSEMET